MSAAMLVVSCGSKSRSPPLNDDVTAPGAANIGTKECEDLKKRVVACYDDYCTNDGGTAPFCGCWNKGMDIETRSCACIRLDLDSICRFWDFENFSPSLFSCSDATSIVGSLCN
jgi:hypothetical protein